MTDRPDTTHPSEDALLAWLDEPERAPADVREHLAACAACRERAAGFEAVLAGLGEAPPPPSAEALAEQRRRIAAAIAPRRDRRIGWVWAPALAAAALAALLVWGPWERPAGPPTVAETPTTSALPATVADQGERTADALVATVATGTPATAVPAEAVVDSLDQADVEALASIEAVTPSTSDETANDATALSDEFAELSTDDQGEILDELSQMTFDL